jgi:hypothetical protein
MFFAAGTKGNNARANGSGGFLARGHYFKMDKTLYGPFKSEPQAELVRSIVNSRRLHESDLFTCERNALRALRRQGVVANVGLYLTPATREKLCTEQ